MIGLNHRGTTLDKPLTWAEIDLNAIAHNIIELKNLIPPETRLMAVVKANAYGHGAVEVAECALEAGAAVLGVARIDEAIQLREAGLTAPILVFGYTPPERVGKLLAYELTQTVYTLQTAKRYADEAAAEGKKLNGHIKIDTGMGRLGLLPDEFRIETRGSDNALDEIESITRLAGLQIEGIYTHFATADSADKSHANEQLQRFLDFSEQLRKTGLEPTVKHAANSAAVIDLPESHLDMVRPGISVYGLYPSDEVAKNRVALKPAMALKSRIIQLKNVSAGFKISYGATFTTECPSTIATVPVGYADGFNRLLSSRGHMLVHGQKAPIVGRVCMDLTMLDVSHIHDVEIEDEVVIFGHQGKAVIPADEIAASLNTINYEIVSTLMPRVKRIYITNKTEIK
jgi:alanine racemase